MSNSDKSARPQIRRDHSSTPNTQPLDVICAGMYRACSTWQYTVAAHLIERYRGGKRLGYLSGEEYANRRIRLDGPPRATKGHHAQVEANGCTVFKSHDGDRFFAKSLADRRALVLYAYRDVRDVIFSLMHKRGATFEQILKQGMIQQILANDRFWTRGDRVLIQKYEDLVAEPTIGVQQIASHLGIEIDSGEATQIALEYSAESNRARIVTLQSSLKESGLDLHDASNLQICDPTTLLHWNHLRPASTETWRDLATASQRRILERMFGNWLADRGYARDDFRTRATMADRLREESATLRGWVSCRIYNGSLNFPKASRFAKGLLKRGTSTKPGAVAWDEANPKSKDLANHSTPSR